MKLQTQMGLVSDFRRIAASLFSIDFALLKNSSEWILAHTLTISLTEAPELHRLARNEAALGNNPIEEKGTHTFG